MTGRALGAGVTAGVLLLTTSCGSGGQGGSGSGGSSGADTHSPTSSTTATSSTPAGSPSHSSVPVRGSTADPRTSDLVTDLTSPWGLVVSDDGSALVSERDTKKIKKVSAGKHRAHTVTTLDAARPNGEGGLLGLAATKDEKTIFAYYTSARDNRIVKMSWDGHRLGKPKVILTGIPKGTFHNGGRMIMGKHGYLYVGTGETQQEKLSQDTDSLGGKILRITQNGKPAPGNPFHNRVYSYGHRNVEGLAFDSRGRLWASEFGADKWDELNLIEKGKNYGWPKVEGKGGGKKYTDPVRQWHTGQASPSGLAFWKGSLWMASLRGNRLWQIPLAKQKTRKPVAHYVHRYGRLRTVAGGPHDTLWLGTSNTDSRGEPKKGDDRLLLLKQ